MEAKGIAFGDIEGLKFSHAFNYDLEKYNPFEDAAGYAGPTLLVRGTRDELADEATCETSPFMKTARAVLSMWKMQIIILSESHAERH